MSPRLPTILAFFRREIRTCFRNRFLHGFTLLALSCGIGVAVFAPSTGSIPYLQLQVILYLIPLFGVLIGVSSSHGELEERAFLLSQPISRLAWVCGKAAALVPASAGILVLVFVPAAFAGGSIPGLIGLWAQGASLAAVFLLLGLAVGFSTEERVRGLIYGVLLWLFLLVGFGLLAFAGAQTPFFRESPVLWLAVLLLNPVETTRVAALFQLEEIPFRVPVDAVFVEFWIEHLFIWNFLLAGLWIAGLLAWSRFRLERRGG